ncbi:MAG: hypothetical protein WBV46_15545 [Terriglobales bacterium]
MNARFLSKALTIVLSLALATPAPAKSLQSTAGEIEVGIGAAAAAVVVVVIIVAVHYSKKRSITGCVASVGNGMTVTDENSKRVYALSGNTLGVKPGERMKLNGQKTKSQGPETILGWEATKVNKDFGVCQP